MNQCPKIRIKTEREGHGGSKNGMKKHIRMYKPSQLYVWPILYVRVGLYVRRCLWMPLYRC